VLQFKAKAAFQGHRTLFCEAAFERDFHGLIPMTLKELEFYLISSCIGYAAFPAAPPGKKDHLNRQGLPLSAVFCCLLSPPKALHGHLLGSFYALNLTWNLDAANAKTFRLPMPLRFSLIMPFGKSRFLPQEEGLSIDLLTRIVFPFV